MSSYNIRRATVEAAGKERLRSSADGSPHISNDRTRTVGMVSFVSTKPDTFHSPGSCLGKQHRLRSQLTNPLAVDGVSSFGASSCGGSSEGFI